MRKKIILGLCLLILSLLALFCGTVMYYYSHPSATKGLIEKGVSSATGTSLTIKDLSYSLKPFSIQAKGVTIKPGKNLAGFHLEIHDVKVDLALEGPFGERDLLITNLRVDGFSLRISEEMTLPALFQKAEGPSFLARVVKKIKALLLFREIRLVAGECVNGDMTARLKGQVVGVSNMRAMFKADGLREIVCSAYVKQPLKGMHFEAPDLRVFASPGLSPDQASTCLVTAKKATYKGRGGEVKRIDIKARLICDLRDKDLAFEPVDILLQGVRLDMGAQGKSSPRNLLLRTKGRVNIGEGDVNAPDFHLTLTSLPGGASHGWDSPIGRRQGNIFELKGDLRARFGASNMLDLRVLEGRLFPQRLRAFLPQKIRDALHAISLSGPVAFSGPIKGRKELQTWNWHGDLEARLRQNRFSYRTGQIKLDSLISGSMQAKWEFPFMEIAMVFQGDKTSFAGKAEALKPWQASLSLTGKNATFVVKKLALYVPQVKVFQGDRDFTIRDIRLHGEKGSFDGEKRSLILPEIRLSTSLLTNTRLYLGVDGKGVTLKAEGKEANLLRTALGLNLIPLKWQLMGHDSFHIEAVQKEKGVWSFRSRVGFLDVGFENREGTAMGEKISLKAGMDGEIDLEKAQVSAHASLEMDGGEVLYDRFYFDLNRNPFFSHYQGAYDMSKGSLTLSSLGFGFKHIAALQLKGTLRHKGDERQGHLYLHIPKTPLKPLFRHVIQEPFQTEKAFLQDLEIGGNLSADLEWMGRGADWLVMGRLKWKDGWLSVGDKGLSIQGVDLELPVWRQTGKGKGEGGGPKGALSIRSMVLPLLPEQSLNIPLYAGPNLLSVRSPTFLKVPGGVVRIGPIVGRNIFGPQPSIETNLTMNSVDVKPLLSRFWPKPIEGTIGGKLDPLRFEGDALSSHGEIRARVFDGEVILSNVGASGMFTSTPVFRLNALIKNLSLEEPTSGTPFGKIEGVLKGHIHNLEIAYGQPQRFDLLLETVRQKGVSQKISVKAVENIAQIGGGQSPFLGLAGGLAYFFKEFPYRKIGVRSSLENDVFRINGTVMERGREYLVKRGRFSGVDIVNQNPDNRISFRDMVKRIKRVTAGKGGPVIR
ncbi:MAG: hypothetical protein GY849_15325 [Deltaproteobacteria bacterium]|nr:hypothetical protein [Deltaproteobacteria bacterium]